MILLARVLAAAGEVQSFCSRNRWRFCFIGGIAIQRWGEPRLTQYVDITLLTGFGNEESYVDTLLSDYASRRPDSRDFALSRRVLLLRTKSDVDLDIALGAFPFEERSIQRATDWNWMEGEHLNTCSAEDLIVHKSFAGRDLDWGDVERVLIRQHKKLNLAQIRFELGPLLELKGDMESMHKLDLMITKVDRRLAAKP